MLPFPADGRPFATFHNGTLFAVRMLTSVNMACAGRMHPVAAARGERSPQPSDKRSIQYIMSVINKRGAASGEAQESGDYKSEAGGAGWELKTKNTCETATNRDKPRHRSAFRPKSRPAKWRGDSAKSCQTGQIRRQPSARRAASGTHDEDRENAQIGCEMRNEKSGTRSQKSGERNCADASSSLVVRAAAVGACLGKRGDPGSVLGLSWLRRGSILASFWGHPGFVLGLSWPHPGSVLLRSYSPPAS